MGRVKQPRYNSDAGIGRGGGATNNYNKRICTARPHSGLEDAALGRMSMPHGPPLGRMGMSHGPPLGRMGVARGPPRMRRQ